jgi:uncharacterized protein YndB with AHSA1/START domain
MMQSAPVRRTEVHQHVAASRAIVYRLLLDPLAVAQWKVPDGMTGVVHRFEPHVGGQVHVSLTYEDTSAVGKTEPHTDSYRGYFVELVPDTLVVERDRFDSKDATLSEEMTSRIELRDAPEGGTLVTGIHEPVPKGVRLEDNAEGWRMSLAKLAALAERVERTGQP